MTSVYQYLGTSKQAHHQQLGRQRQRAQVHRHCVNLIEHIRSIHPAMGLVQIYQLTQPGGIGRKAFVELGKQEGFPTAIDA